MDGDGGDDFMVGDASSYDGTADGSGDDIMNGGGGGDFMVGDAFVLTAPPTAPAMTSCTAAAATISWSATLRPIIRRRLRQRHHARRRRRRLHDWRRKRRLSGTAVGSGNDIMHGGGGDDFMVGDVSGPTNADGSGNDVMHGDGGDDFMVGDAMTYAMPPTAPAMTLMDGGAGSDTLYGDAVAPSEPRRPAATTRSRAATATTASTARAAMMSSGAARAMIRCRAELGPTTSAGGGDADEFIFDNGHRGLAPASGT